MRFLLPPLALLACSACSSGPTTLDLKLVVDGAAAPRAITVSVFDPHGPLAFQRPIATPALPGDLLIELPSADEEVRVAVGAVGDPFPVGQALGGAAFAVLAQRKNSDSLTLSAATADVDRDGVPDGIDNCPTVANPKQESAHGGPPGDACAFDGGPLTDLGHGSDGPDLASIDAAAPVDLAATTDLARSSLPDGGVDATLGEGGPRDSSSGDAADGAPAGPLVAGSASAVAGATGTSISIAAPPGLAVGDLLILSVFADQSVTLATPSGWTRYADVPGNGLHVWLFTRFAVASEPSPYSVTFPQAVGNQAVIVSYRNASMANPIAAYYSSGAINGVAGASTITFTSPQSLAIPTGDRALALFYYVGGSGESWSAGPAGTSSLVAVDQTAAYDGPASISQPVAATGTWVPANGLNGAVLVLAVAPR